MHYIHGYVCSQTHRKREEMFPEAVSEEECRAGVRERQKDCNPVTDPLEDVVTNIPAQDQQRQHKLYAQAPAHSSPIYLYKA